jgi:pilus assembly protein CpaC
MNTLRPRLRAAAITGVLAAALLWPEASHAQATPGQPARAPQAISVPVGGQELVPVGTGVRRIAVGNPQVADVTFVDGRLRILGLTAGSTDIFVWRGNTPERLRVSVAAGIEAVRTAPGQDPGLGNVSVGSEDGRVVLRGDVPNLEAQRRLTEPLRGRDVIDQTRVTGETVVAVDVLFAAVQATRLQQFGFNFRALGTSVQGSLTGPGQAVSSSTIGGGINVVPNRPAPVGLGALAGAASPVGPSLGNAFSLLLGNSANNLFGAVSMLASTNFAQVLAQPVLLVRSGEQASFLAGGEIPVPTPVVGAGFSSVTIEYRPFGVRLDIAAVVMSDERIVLRVAPEVSELDYTNAVTLQGFNIPALRKRSASTTVELTSGQSFMLAGLTMTNTSNLAERVPALGELPVIGPLFSRTNATREAQELVIIATPRLVRPMDPRRIPAGITERAAFPDTGDILLQRNTPEAAANRFGLMR